MRKLKILMITSIVILAATSPIFAKDIVTRPSGGYYSSHAHHGQGQKLGGKSGDKSAKGLENASRRSKGAVCKRDGGKK